MVFNNAGNNSHLLEDMDTSESEHSADEIHSDLDAADDDPEWEVSIKRQAKKRNSKTEMDSNSEGLKADGDSGEGMVVSIQKTASGVCCTCSRSSSCKTTRCECRAGGESCGISCNCVPTKCSNREAAIVKVSNHSTQSELADSSDEKERSQDLVSHGAMLLQSALAEKPVETNDENEPRRKPLSDIGNTVV